MIHCDKTTLKISGMVSDVIDEFAEIVTTLVTEGVLSPKTSISFNVEKEDNDIIENMINGSVMTYNKYGGN